ncbi:MAG: hypothetical protein IPL72_13890 [Sulfuritalea sp.]|nr:hypothetical protein [Sulfuritalea sp.]
MAKDALLGGDGADLLAAGAGDDLLIGDASVSGDVVDSWEITLNPPSEGNGGNYVYTLNGVTGLDDGEGLSGADSLYGGAGVDWLLGNGGNDLLDGGTGNDVLFGGANNDTLIGGQGTDVLVGGAGLDTYVFHKGDGKEQVIDENAGGLDASVMVFGKGIAKEGIKLRKGSLLLDLGDGDAIHIENFDPDNPLAAPTFSSFQFADGSSLTWEELLAKGFDLDGTDGDDQIVGTGVADRIDGWAGNDTIWGGNGDDVLIGGAGTDWSDGGLGDDTYIVHVGDAPADFEHGLIEAILDEGGTDTLILEGIDPAGVQVSGTLNGELRITFAGTDQLAIVGGIAGTVENFALGGETLRTAEFIGRHAETALAGTDAAGNAVKLGGQRNDTLTALTGRATLSGGRGNDVLEGSGGNNTYLYSIGDGTDSLTDSSAKLDAQGVAQLNTLKVGAGVTAEDIHIRAGDEGVLILQIGADANDAIHIQSFDPASQTGAIDLIQFVDGSTLTYADLLARGSDITGTDGDDILTASVLLDRLAGGLGNDTYRLINATDATDEIIEAENAGIDTIETAIDYTLGANAENLTLTGAAISGSGNALDNLLTGNALDNTLAGGEGNDTYRLARQSGNDVVIDAGANRILLGTGLAFDDIAATRDGDDLLLAIRRDTGSLRVQGYFTDGAVWQVSEADGVQRNTETLLADTAAYEEDRIATLARDFLADTRLDIEHSLTVQGYAPQADGTWRRVTQFADSLRVSQTDQATTTIHTGKFNNGVVAWTSNLGTEHTYSWNQTGAAERSEGTANIRQSRISAAGAEVHASGGDSQYSSQWLWAEVSWGAPLPGATTRSSRDETATIWTVNGAPGWLHITYNHDFVTTNYQGSLTGRYLDGQGTGNLPAAVAMQLTSSSLSYHLEEIDLTDGDHLVYASGHSAVIGGVGNNTIYNAGFAYGGTGNGRLIGGNMLVAGSGDQWLEGGAMMVVGDGHDTVVAVAGQVVEVGRYNTGSDLVLGQGVDTMTVVDAYYQTQGITDWQESYEQAGQYYLANGEFGQAGYFDSLIDLESGLEPWASLSDLLSWGTVRRIEPLPFLVHVPGRTQPGLYYEQNSVPVVTLSAKDFEGLQPFYDSGVLGSPTVSFGAGIVRADLQFSWGEAVSPLDGSRHVTLDIGWGPDQGIRVLAPRSDDLLGASVNDFRFADGDRASLSDLIALAPPAPDFDLVSTSDFVGTEGDDLLDGTANIDTVYGLGGNDTLVGGSGDDVLDGGSGDDTYRFGLDDGADAIVDAEGTDQLVFGTGILASDVTASRTDSRVTVSVSETDSVSFDEIAPGQYAIESIVFEDGVWQASDIRQLVNSAPTGTVGVGGTAIQGETLIASNTLADADGIGAIDYQWQSSADAGATWVDIAGAATGSLTLGEMEVGSVVRVVASYTDDHGTTESVASDASTMVEIFNSPPTGTVSIVGIAAQNQTLGVINNLADAEGLGPATYQWSSSIDGMVWSAIDGATADSFTLGESQVGRRLRVVASYIDGIGKVESVASSATDTTMNVNDAPSGIVVVDGAATQGQVLTATNNLDDADGLGGIGYQWQSSADAGMTWNPIAGATTSAFELTEAQVGQSVRVHASYIDGHDTLESVTSAATDAIGNINDVPTGIVDVGGTATEGQTLTATNTLVDSDGLGSIGYQWQMSADSGATWTEIAGATGDSYMLSEAEIGKTVRVVASYIDGHDTTESRASAASMMVTAMPGRVHGTDSNEFVYGSEVLNDTIFGYAGNDWLIGRGGDDTLIGGTGDDALSGGSGSDVYMFGLGDGHDSIFDPEANDSPRSDDINALRFGEGIASSDVRGTGNGSDLILTVQSTGESVTLWSWRNPAYDHVSRVEFYDGTVWDEATLSAAAMNVVGTDGDDDLQGRALADILTGVAGNDDLIGWGGDDTLIGGTGDDTLSGGSGSDVYMFGLGDGHDVVPTTSLAIRTNRATSTSFASARGLSRATYTGQ